MYEAVERVCMKLWRGCCGEGVYEAVERVCMKLWRGCVCVWSCGEDVCGEGVCGAVERVYYLLLNPGWSRSWHMAAVMRVARSRGERCCFR